MVLRIFDTIQNAGHRYLPPSLRQFVKFGMVGSVAFLVDFSTYTLLTRVLGVRTVYCFSLGGSLFSTSLDHIQTCAAPYYPIVVGNMLSVLVAVICGFLLNKYWTFRDTSAHVATQGVAYGVMSGITWALNQVVTGLFASRLEILHTVFQQNVDLAAKILAVGVVMFVNFSGSKFLVFRRKSASVSSPTSYGQA